MEEEKLKSFKNLVLEEPVNWATEKNTRIRNMIEYYLFPRTQALCRGEPVNAKKIHFVKVCISRKYFVFLELGSGLKLSFKRIIVIPLTVIRIIISM